MSISPYESKYWMICDSDLMSDFSFEVVIIVLYFKLTSEFSHPVGVF